MGAHKERLLRKRATEALEGLSEAGLKVAVDFLEYLQGKEEWEATREIMADPETMAAIQEAENDWKAGRMDQFVSLAEAKRRVQSRTQPTGG